MCRFGWYDFNVDLIHVDYRTFTTENIRIFLPIDWPLAELEQRVEISAILKWRFYAIRIDKKNLPTRFLSEKNMIAIRIKSVLSNIWVDYADIK